MAKKKKNFEESLERLEEIVDIIGDGDTSLEESINLYKEGVILSNFCIESLNKIEKDVMILTEDLEKGFKQVPLDYTEKE